MNKNRILYGLVLLFTAATVVYGMWGMLNQPKEEAYCAVSVVLDDSSSSRWIPCKKGMEQAASEFHIRLNVVTTGKFNDADEIKTICGREIRNGAEGLIIQSNIAAREEKLLPDSMADTYVVLIDQDLSEGEYYSSVKVSHDSMGRDIIRTLKSDMGEERLRKSTIGVIVSDKNLLSEKQMLESLKQELTENGGEITWKVYACEEQKTELEYKLKQQPVDVLLCLGNNETELAVEELQSSGDEYAKMEIYGVGCSETLIHALKSGMIRRLLVPNELLMGYLSVEALYQQIMNKSKTVKSIQIDYLNVDKTNMYEKENQHILFPVIQ